MEKRRRDSNPEVEEKNGDTLFLDRRMQWVQQRMSVSGSGCAGEEQKEGEIEIWKTN